MDKQLELPFFHVLFETKAAIHCAICKKRLASNEIVYYTTFGDGHHRCEHIPFEITEAKG